MSSTASGIDRRLARACALACASAILLAACGSRRAPLKPADDLYAEAREYHEKESYVTAIETYKQLLDNYPLDPRAEELEILIAQAHYSNESYPEAIAAYSDFQRMHPTSPRLPEVEYSIGQAYSDQMTTIDRDLTAATNAAQRYESVLGRYPRSEHAESSRSKLKEARDHLAERELYIAEFYYGRGKDAAGRARIIELLSRFPETPAAGEGLARLRSDAEASGDANLVAAVDAAIEERSRALGVPVEGKPDAAPGLTSTSARTQSVGPATIGLVRLLRERQGRSAVASAVPAGR